MGKLSVREGVIFISKNPGKAYTKQLSLRYQKAEKNEKRDILDEFIETTEYHRKSAIRILSGKYTYTTTPIKRPRKKRYDIVDALVLTKICELFDWINSKRVQPQIGLAIDSLVGEKELVVSREQRAKLIKISPATIDRLLKTHKKRPVGKGKSYTKPGTLLKHQIPIRTFADWNENKVGFFEIDLVGHEGGLAKGDFGWTLQFVDIKSCWTEEVAVKNKAQVHVFAGIKRIRLRLLFPILGLDSDSGSEFINDQLNRYCIEEKITFTKGVSSQWWG